MERRIRQAHFAETKNLEGFDWKFNPTTSTGCRSKSWPPAISSGAAVLLGKAAGKPSEAAIRPTEIGVRASGFMLLMAVVFLLHLINGARAECLYTMGMDFDAVGDPEAASRAYR